jgi:hypothetical protein
VKGPFRRATWYSHIILDADGETFCETSGEAETQWLLNILNNGHAYGIANVHLAAALAEARAERDATVKAPSYTLDTFDDNDLCDAFMGLPVEFFNPGPDFGDTTYTPLWRQAVVNMARPGDVANLIMERDAYIEAARRFVVDLENLGFGDADESVNGGDLIDAMDTHYRRFKQRLTK